MNLTTLTNRDNLGRFLTDNGLLGVGVEVGAKNCANARQIVSTWQDGKLHIIDTWGGHDPASYKERTDWTNFDDCHKECCDLASEYPQRVELHKGKSLDCVGTFQDESLDFVYIDADHGYHAVIADCVAWWPKVKRGGLFCGHDFYDDQTFPSHCLVQSALGSWLPFMGLPTPHRTECTSWWIEKT
jgi:hypothetical protein